MKTRICLIAAVLSFGTVGTLSLAGCASGGIAKSTGEYIDDAAITAKVKGALFQDPIVSGLAVNVDTYKAIVQLNGFVDSPQQKTRAEQIARNVPGVQGVQNKLTVKTNIPQK